MDMFSKGDRKQNRIHCPLHLHFAPLSAPLRARWARQGVSRGLQVPLGAFAWAIVFMSAVC